GLLSSAVVFACESRDRFSALLGGFQAEYDPRTETETALVETMAICRWRQLRLWAMETSSLEHEMRNQHPQHAAENPPTRAALAFRTLSDESRSLDLYNRYETRYDRQFSRALTR